MFKRCNTCFGIFKISFWLKIQWIFSKGRRSRMLWHSASPALKNCLYLAAKKGREKARIYNHIFLLCHGSFLKGFFNYSLKAFSLRLAVIRITDIFSWFFYFHWGFTALDKSSCSGVSGKILTSLASGFHLPVHVL